MCLLLLYLVIILILGTWRPKAKSKRIVSLHNPRDRFLLKKVVIRSTATIAYYISPIFNPPIYKDRS